MACRGVYCALTDDEARKLLTAETDPEVLAIVQETIEREGGTHWVHETDKAWDAMHRCLTDGTFECKGKSILEKCVLGGRPLYRGKEYLVSFLSPDEVRDVSNALRPIQQDWFRENYFGLKRKFLWFDRTGYEGTIDEDEFQYTWACFEDTRIFFQRAAGGHRAVIFTAGQ